MIRPRIPHNIITCVCGCEETLKIEIRRIGYGDLSKDIIIGARSNLNQQERILRITKTEDMWMVKDMLEY